MVVTLSAAGTYQLLARGAGGVDELPITVGDDEGQEVQARLWKGATLQITSSVPRAERRLPSVTDRDGRDLIRGQLNLRAGDRVARRTPWRPWTAEGCAAPSTDYLAPP